MFESRPDPDADARPAFLDGDSPNERLRTEGPVAMVEARDEVGDLDRSAFSVKHCFQNGGVVNIGLFRGLEAYKLDGKGAIGRITARASEKLVKNGIAVEPWKTAPNDPGFLVDEGAYVAVADEPQIEITHVDHFLRGIERWQEARSETRQHFRRAHEPESRLDQL